MKCDQFTQFPPAHISPIDPNNYIGANRLHPKNTKKYESLYMFVPNDL